MKTFYLAQGRLTNNPPLVKANSSAFLYGESAFTSFIVQNMKVTGLDFHKKRILRAAKAFWDVDAEALWLEAFEALKAVSGKLKTVLGQKNFKARLTIYKDEVVQSYWSFEEYESAQNTKKVETLNWERPQSSFNFKSADYAKIFSLLRLSDCDDFLKTGANEEIYELTTSNILLSKKGALFTPPVNSNVLEGTQIALLKSLSGFSVEEKKLYLKDVYDADFVLGSNAVKQFFVISQLDKKPLPYSKNQVAEFFDKYQNEASLVMVDLC